MQSASPTRLSTLIAAVQASNLGDIAASGSSGSSAQSPPIAAGVGAIPGWEEEEVGEESVGRHGHKDDDLGPVSGAMLFPQQRMVQSARPVTRGGQELDPGVWRDKIASQVR